MKAGIDLECGHPARFYSKTHADLFKYLLLSLLPPIDEVFHYISAFESVFSFCFSPRMLRSFIISEGSAFAKTPYVDSV